MTATRVLVVDPSGQTDELKRDTLVWRTDGPSSFHTDLTPALDGLGTPPVPNRDAVWLTTTVFVADRTIDRPANKTRDIRIVVPVSDPAGWNGQRTEIESLLGGFTSDRWTVDFVHAPPGAAAPTIDEDDVDVDVVSLLSGGADSLCGALRALAAGRTPLLLSHWDTNAHKPIQSELVARLQDIFGVAIEHRQVRVARADKQIGGRRFPNENTKRSRSLLFLALGLAQAAARGGVDMWIPENGFASLNPPLAPERAGAMSTRTTDPRLLRGFSAVLRAVSAHSAIVNPFETATKGEMFAELAGTIGEDQASKLLSATHSCSHSRLAGQYDRPLTSQCGLCFGCLLRRSAFAASDLEDRTPYLAGILADEDLDRFLARWSEDLHALRYAVERGIGIADVAALRLPDGYPPDDAHDLLVRGLSELERVTG